MSVDATRLCDWLAGLPDMNVAEVIETEAGVAGHDRDTRRPSGLW